MTIFAQLILFSVSISYSATSVTQHGITWTFTEDKTIGQFVNGDYWVIGPVTINNIYPGYATSPRIMNGTTIDDAGLGPGSSMLQGFDGATCAGSVTYDASKNVGVGQFTVGPGHSIISTISNPEACSDPYQSMIQTSAILTVVDSTQPTGAFRPGYQGTTKTVYNYNNLDKTKLKNLTYSGKPEIDGIIAGTSISFIHSINWASRYLHPIDFYGDNYYWPVSVIGTIGLMLHLDYDQQKKDQLLIDFIQIGIDMFSILESSGIGWSPDGGSKNGAKLPILYAAILFNDSEMLSYLQRSGNYLFENGKDQTNIPSDYIKFGEDAVMYINQTQIDITAEESWDGYLELRGADEGADHPYTQSLLGMPEWLNRNNDNWGDCNSDWTTPYRTIGTGGGGYFPAAALSVLLIGGKSEWNNSAFFDYVKRYMAISSGNSDPFGFTVTSEMSGGRPVGFIADMYDLYFDQYNASPVAPPYLRIKANGKLMRVEH